MRLVQLIYASRATLPPPLTELVDILVTARAVNPTLGVSGFLCFGSERYLQVLEGEADVVNRLYLRILHDRRHCDCRLVHYGDVRERRFPNWKMGFCDLGQVLSEPGSLWRPLALRNGVFAPAELNAEDALGLLQDLAHVTDPDDLPVGMAQG